MDTSQELYYQRFQALFAQHYSSLCNYALTFVKDPHTSEDIVQEVFIRIWETRRSVVIEDAARYYLFTAVRNNCITWLRKEKNTGPVEWADQEMANPEDFSHVRPSGKEMNYDQVLQEGIDRLPPKCREVFLLSRMGNLKYREIADTLGISTKTVENQLSKALKIMRTLLKEKGIYFLPMLVLFFAPFCGGKGHFSVIAMWLTYLPWKIPVL